MRVISGIARRTPLIAPKGYNTRPTSDKSRESLFNILSQTISGARFLDLFCGSGAIGIEALSRGAEHAVFVDSSRAAQESTLANLHRTKLVHKSEFFKLNVLKALDDLENLKKGGEGFNFIFLDPPYEDIIILNKTLQKLSSYSLLVEEGVIIAEISNKAQVIIPDSLELISKREYGRVCFLFLKKL